MSIRSIAVVVLAAALGTPMAFAASGFTLDNSEVGGKSHPMTSSKTRAQVKQELAAARADGFLGAGEGEASGPTRVESPAGTSVSRGKTRAQVKQELAAARADGSLRAGEREASAPTRVESPAGTSVSRDQVKSEARQAQAAGTLRQLNRN